MGSSGAMDWSVSVWVPFSRQINAVFESERSLLLKISAGAFVGFFVGASLARREGIRAITRMTEATARGELPSGAMFDGMAIFLGGALLLTPGFITDGIGFALLVPGSRNFLREGFLSWFGKRIQSGHIMVNMNGFDPTQGPNAPGPRGPRGPGVGNGRVYDQTLDEED